MAGLLGGEAAVEHRLFQPGVTQSDGRVMLKGAARVAGTASWYLVTAESDELIAAVKDACIVSGLLGDTAKDVSRVAGEVCLRARALLETWHTQRCAGVSVPATAVRHRDGAST